MADDFDDFDFADDDALDQLPTDEIAELEHNAFLSTQHARIPVVKREYGESQRRAGRAGGSEVTRAPSDYGLDDEDIINLDDQPIEIQQAYDRFSQHQRIIDRVTQAPVQGDAHMQDGNSVNVLELQERVLQLENDRAKLQRLVEEARSAAQSKAGEAAVLRHKYESSAKEHEQKILTLRQLHQDAYNKQKAELEAVKRERERIADSNKFLEQDIAREASRVRQVQRTLKDVTNNKSRESGGDAQTTTPKKSRVMPFRDGFDDSDMFISPSKSKDRSRVGTPKAGGKRKRPGTTPQDSPVQMEPLILSQPRPQPSPMSAPRHQEGVPPGSKDPIEQSMKFPERPSILQMVLNQKMSGSEDRVMEVLTSYAFPSKPDKKLSSMVYDSLGGTAAQDRSMSEVLCDCFVSMWDQCLKEAFHEPIDIIVDTIRLILSNQPLAFTRKYISALVPLCMSTVDIVAIPLARASLALTNTPAHPHPPLAQQATAKAPQSPIKSPRISIFETLIFLRTIALSCVGHSHQKDMELFWSHMKFDFVLLMLMRAQPVPQISLMLSVLRLSTLPRTFGAILSDEEGGEERQARRESETLDRLTLLLTEKFPVPSTDRQSEDGEEGGDGDANPFAHHKAVLELRVQVLRVFQALLLTTHGSLLLATHKYFLGRLVRYLDTTITSLYTHYHPSTHPLLTSSVNLSTRIIYTLLTSPPTEGAIDIRAKLSVVPQGVQRWLIALTRLAFADPVVYERGISAESMDAAHHLLDEWVSPVEGEGLLMIFGAGEERKMDSEEE